MPKNFDDHRQKKAEATRAQREFVLGGEPFTARASVRPEAFMEWDSLDMENTPPAVILQTADNTILTMIEKKDDAHNRYRAVREREDDAISLDDLVELIQWLVEFQSGTKEDGETPSRPTEPSSASATSQGETGTPSTPDSSSQESTAEPELSTLGSS